MGCWRDFEDRGEKRSLHTRADSLMIAPRVGQQQQKVQQSLSRKPLGCPTSPSEMESWSIPADLELWGSLRGGHRKGRSSSLGLSSAQRQPRS